MSQPGHDDMDMEQHTLNMMMDNVILFFFFLMMVVLFLSLMTFRV